MTVKLFTRDGGFVHEAAIPPFNPPPEVIGWGSRVFVRGADYDGTIQFDDVGTTIVNYTEALCFVLPAAS